MTAAVSPRRYAMARPSHFDVVYAINPWMTPGTKVNQSLAMEQWGNLKSTYESLGHQVDVVEGVPGLPDMVFAANCSTIIGERAYLSNFRFPERKGETAVYSSWLKEVGFDIIDAEHTNEGEGDFLVLKEVILAGTGFRTSIEAHVELEMALGRPVVPLHLVNPSFYHLDVAIAVLDDGLDSGHSRIAYYPGAFSMGSRRTLQAMFPDAIEVSESEAMAFALNAVSDGHNVVMPTGAELFAERVGAAGFNPVEVELSEFLKAGGSVKCCTLEFH